MNFNAETPRKCKDSQRENQVGVPNPERDCGMVWFQLLRNSVGVGLRARMFTQGSSFLATLGWRTQSLRDWKRV